jgi:predicted ATPase
MLTDSLDSITIQGFKSIASMQDLKLNPVNVVIGANGSGKSNFMAAFDFLRAISEGRLNEYVKVAGGSEKVLHFGSKVTSEINFHLSFESPVGHYDLTLSPTADDGLFPSSESVFDGSEHHSSLVGWQEGKEAGISYMSPGRISPSSWSLLPLPSQAKRVWWKFRRWRPFHLDDTSSSSWMRKTGMVDDNRFLKSDGRNIAGFLYFLRKRNREQYDFIVNTVRQVAPFFDDFQLEPLQLNPDSIKLEWRHRRSDQYFDASSLSDGTLRFIVLATLFLQPVELRPSIILVDEPELGLHPYAIEKLAALVRQASVDTQVILSTQSSLLLDYFEPEEILVADRVNGGTQLTRLQSPQLKKWLEDYSLGQLWEKNEIGGRPVPA